MSSPAPHLTIIGDSGEHHQPRPLASAEEWTLEVSGHVRSPRTFTLQELLSLVPQTVRLRRPVECVSAGRIARRSDGAEFGGVPFQALADAVGVLDSPSLELGPTVEWVSRAGATLGPRRMPHITHLALADALDPEHQLLLATELEGQPLPYQHGGPLRLVVGPGLFFYKSLKWLGTIRFLDRPLEECRGTWEEYAGYHNRARVAKNERFEPRMFRILEVVQDDEGFDEDRTGLVAEEDWERTFQQAYEARDFSRLIAAHLHKMVKLPKDFTGGRFTQGSYRSKIRGTSFASADLRGADLSHGNYSLSKFTNVKFADDPGDARETRSGEFAPACLDGADFEGAYFNNACLIGVSMRGAYLNNATFFAPNKSDQPTHKVRGLDVRGAQRLDPGTARWLAANDARVDEESLTD